MARLEMKISAEEYQTKIDNLINLEGRLADKIRDYRAKEQELNNFVGEADSNFENLRENVRANLEAAQRSYTIAKNAHEALQKALTEMTGTTSQNKATITDSTDKLKSTIASKLPVNELLET